MGKILFQSNVSDEKTALKVSLITIVLNLLLSIFKFIAGIIANSGAMISDAVHSASDVFSTIIVIAGIRFSNVKSDEEHQYGHERIESVASILLALMLFITGAGIGINGIQVIINGNNESLLIPGKLALIAAILSIIVKEWMYWFTRAAAKKINSGAMMADAWHHRTDALSSVGAFIGILGARLGFPIFDPLASVVICIFILKASIDIFKDAVDRLIDKSCDISTVNKMKEVVSNQDGIVRIDMIRTRLFGSKTYVDIEIAVDRTITIEAAHDIAQQVHDLLENEFPLVKHCMVHVNPD